MRIWKIALILVLLCFTSKVNAQQDPAYAEKVKQYITQYKELAMIEQMHSGMPAAIILAQAILETEAGTSELVKEANNHFGIKCKIGWNGPTFIHTDEQPDECFRKYFTVAESYKDHSDYLKNTPRYAPLFKLSVTDYAAWAFTLRQCGYATNPTYAQRLIGIIEDYKLQEYTYQVMNASNYATQNNTTTTPNAKAIKSNAPPVKTDTVAFSKAKNAKTQEPVKKTVKANDTGLVVNYSDPAVKKPISAAKVQDTTYTRAITNIASAQTQAKQADTGLLVKDTISKPAIFENDSNGRVPANINSQAATNSLTTDERIVPNNEPKIIMVHGLTAFQAHKGDMLLEFAVRNKIRYAKLLEINDLPDAALEKDMYIYLEKKGTEGAHPTHIVQSGETLQEISQAECIQLKHLMAYNHLEPGDMPAAGAKLFLKQSTAKRPALANAVNTKTSVAPATDAPNKLQTKPASNYISKPLAAEKPAIDTEIKEVPSKKITQTKASAVTKTATAAKTPVQATSNNTADNYSGTEEAPATENPVKPKESTMAVPEDKLSKLKSKLDKVVYSSDNEAAEEPVQAQSAESVQMQQGNIETLKPVQKHVIKIVEDSSQYYTVKDGDTMINIARKFNVSIRQLNLWNNLDIDSGIRKGMKLKVRD